MTPAQIGGLATAVKRNRGACLDNSGIVARYLATNPDVDPREARALAVIYGKQPWPSINGNPPVYRNRPFYDARLHEENP